MSSRPIRRPTRVLLALVATLAVPLAACGGGDDGPGTSPPAGFDLATDGLPPASSTPDRAIDASRLGGFDIGGNVNDGFDRCALFDLAELSELLGGAWELSVVVDDDSACIWKDSPDPPVTRYLRVAVVEATPSDIGGFDPRLGDDASDLDTVVQSALELGDETFEVPTGTYGSGLAFRKGTVAVQVHAIWAVADAEAQARVERQIEFRVAENLASRLP